MPILYGVEQVVQAELQAKPQAQAVATAQARRVRKTILDTAFA